MSDYLKKRQQESLFGKPEQEKKVYKIPKVSKKRASKIAAEKEQRAGADTELQKWYKKIQKHLSGRCWRCGEWYDKKELRYAICATAHILPKSKFPSVATHPLNWLELGAACGCHGWFDGQARVEDVLCDPKIGEKYFSRFLMIYSDIAAEEKKHLPQSLKDLYDEKEPF